MKWRELREQEGEQKQPWSKRRMIEYRDGAIKGVGYLLVDAMTTTLSLVVRRPSHSCSGSVTIHHTQYTQYGQHIQHIRDIGERGKIN